MEILLSLLMPMKMCIRDSDVTYSIDVQSNKIENIEDGKTDSEKERIAISNANVRCV